MEDEKKCRVGGMYEAIYLRGVALHYSFAPHMPHIQICQIRQISFFKYIYIYAFFELCIYIYYKRYPNLPHVSPFATLQANPEGMWPCVCFLRLVPRQLRLCYASALQMLQASLEDFVRLNNVLQQRFWGIIVR